MNLAEATITQLLIPVDDFERGVAFYRDVLGLRLLFAAAPQMGFFQCGAVRLLVGVTTCWAGSAKRLGHLLRGEGCSDRLFFSDYYGSPIQGSSTRRESICRNGNLAGGVCRSRRQSARTNE
jgi:catechol 2,3-dioxygenase-like lactoylglutathione lyase family enzyme